MTVEWTEVLKLAIDILGMEDDAEYREVDNRLYNKYEITLDNLETCVKLLIGRTPTTKLLNGVEAQGFLKKDGSRFIIKEDLDAS